MSVLYFSWEVQKWVQFYCGCISSCFREVEWLIGQVWGKPLFMWPFTRRLSRLSYWETCITARFLECPIARRSLRWALTISNSELNKEYCVPWTSPVGSPHSPCEFQGLKILGWLLQFWRQEQFLPLFFFFNPSKWMSKSFVEWYLQGFLFYQLSP